MQGKTIVNQSTKRGHRKRYGVVENEIKSKVREAKERKRNGELTMKVSGKCGLK